MQLAFLVMELRQLEYFVTVAEEANFTRAAAKPHVAQPGVSAQIRQLEIELGQPLLDRSARAAPKQAPPSSPTPELPSPRSPAPALSSTSSPVSPGATSPSACPPPCPSTCRAFWPSSTTSTQRVEITLIEGRSDQLLGALRTGQLDMALIGSVTAQPPGIETQVVADEPLVAAVTSNDLLATKTSVTLQGLQGRRLISLPQGTGLRSRFDAACAGAATPRPRAASCARIWGLLAS